MSYEHNQRIREVVDPTRAFGAGETLQRRWDLIFVRE